MRLSRFGKFFFSGVALIVVVGLVGAYHLMNKTHAGKVDQGALATIQKVYPKIFDLSVKSNVSSIVNQLYDQNLVTKLYKETANNNGWSILKKRYHVTKQFSDQYQVQSVNVGSLDGIKRANIVLERTIHFQTANKQTLSARQTVYFDLWDESGRWEINDSKIQSNKPV